MDILLNKLRDIELRYQELEGLLSDPQVVSKQGLYQKYAKEHSDLTELVETIRRYEKLKVRIAENRELLSENDEEIRAMAKEEIPVLQKEEADLEEKIKILLLPKDPNDDKNVFLEIRAGTGGDEAALFAADLYRMYSYFAEKRRWKVEILSQNEIGIGGFKEVTFSVKGRGAFSRFKFESGVHRVQRVPETESQGRIHTSTVTVAVLAEVDDIEIDIPDSDIEIDVFKSAGAGGQNVQKNMTAVRIHHKPTGIIVACQDERSQLQNRLRAMSVLKARLYEIEHEKRQSELDATRRSQIGTGERSEKIRTYNFPQSRVTDHRINTSSYNIAGVMDGYELDTFIEELQHAEEAERLANFETND